MNDGKRSQNESLETLLARVDRYTGDTQALMPAFAAYLQRVHSAAEDYVDTRTRHLQRYTEALLEQVSDSGEQTRPIMYAARLKEWVDTRFEKPLSQTSLYGYKN